MVGVKRSKHSRLSVLFLFCATLVGLNSTCVSSCERQRESHLQMRRVAWMEGQCLFCCKEEREFVSANSEERKRSKNGKEWEKEERDREEEEGIREGRRSLSEKEEKQPEKSQQNRQLNHVKTKAQLRKGSEELFEGSEVVPCLIVRETNRREEERRRTQKRGQLDKGRKRR